MKIFSLAITVAAYTPGLIPVLLHSMVMHGTQPTPLQTIGKAPNHRQRYWGSAALAVPRQGTAIIPLPEASRDTGGQSGVGNATFKALAILVSAKDNVYVLHYTLTTFEFMLPR